MTWTIDHVIFFVFLALTMWLGLRSSRGIKNIQDYALSDRNFSTATIVSTIVATTIGGNNIYIDVTETYNNGLYFILAQFGCVLNFVIIGYFFAPRIEEFLGKISIAEAMGAIYGNKVRLITSISGFIGSAGVVAIQLKLAGAAFEYLLNVPSIYGVLMAGVVITVYSSLGGIKSVTFTDLLQFFTFATIIPIVTYEIFFYKLELTDVLNTLQTNNNFNLSNVLDFSSAKTINWFFLFLFFLIPDFYPAFFQRISMCKNIAQVKKSFYLSAWVCFGIGLVIQWLALVILTKNPNIPSGDIVKVLFDSIPPIYKGLLLVGIMAMVMSTVDSFINSSSILFTHDFCQSLKIEVKNKLSLARISSLIIGAFGILLALKDVGLLKLLITMYSFYLPIVTVPFIMALCGYRTPFANAVLSGMGAGLTTVLLWNYYNITIIDAVIPAMLANFCTTVVMHWIYWNMLKSVQ
jgi:Na+/proline symporter